MDYPDLTSNEYYCIEKAIKTSYPRHLKGFHKGWLEIRKSETKFGQTSLKIYSDGEYLMEVCI